MGTVGLNFGALNSGKGIDVTSTVNQIVTNMQAVETPWKNQLSTLSARDTQLSSLGTQLSTLTSDLQKITDFNGVLAGKQGSSSDTSVIALTGAATTATAGTHTVTVNSLAVTSTAASGVVASTDTLTGSLTIQVGSGATQTVNVDSAAPTLSGLAAAINAAGAGVTASVLTDGSGSRLSIVSRTSGAAGQLTINASLTDETTGSPLSVSLAQNGADASLTVNGVVLTSTSNTVTDAISGVTMQLLTAAPGKQVQVMVTNDNRAIESTLSSFVSDYNAVIRGINAQEGTNSSGTAQPLYGSPVVAQLQQQLEQGLSLATGTGAIRSIYDLGLSLNPDGTLTLNTDTLDMTLNNSFSDVVAFFQNAGSFGKNYENMLNNLGTVNPYGTLALALSENSKQEKTLNDDIANEETRIATRKAALTAELNQVNQTLQQIPSKTSYVDEIYAAISGYNRKN